MPQRSRFQSLGDFVNLSDLGNRVHITAQHGTLEVTSAPGGTLRVRLSLEKKLPPYHSLAVAHRFDLESSRPDPLAVKRGRKALEIRAPEVTAQLTLEPLSLSFALPGGAPFGADLELSFRDGLTCVRKSLWPDEHIYGLGEKTGWLDKRHRRYTMRPTDIYLEHPGGIGSATDPLYASFPVFAVHSAEGSYGVFVDNTEFTTFDFTHDDWYEFTAPAEVLNYYVLPGPTLPDILRQYTDLTGRMPLPALWTLGYHQCRWSYSTEADVRRIARELRARKIPADALWCDIDYMDGFQSLHVGQRKTFGTPGS